MAEKKSKKAEIKTKENSASVEDFINNVDGEQKRKDSLVILDMMKKATKEEPKMWGGSIIGFCKEVYKSPATGREVDWFRIGFSPRKANLTLYFMGFGQHEESLKKLGKYKTGSGCLYINKLEDIDIKVLKKMIDSTAKTNLSESMKSIKIKDGKSKSKS
ncbi:MAG: DUF1801 domain-containing protein [Bacteroidetes bacterium]|nr:DUF1801 domain-containing protein [Bacteroidota bacterium]